MIVQEAREAFEAHEDGKWHLPSGRVESYPPQHFFLAEMRPGQVLGNVPEERRLAGTGIPDERRVVMLGDDVAQFARSHGLDPPLTIDEGLARVREEKG